MTDAQAIQRIKEQLQTAFRPLRCVAEDWDYQKRIRFKVFDANGGAVLEMPGVLVRDLADDEQLSAMIDNARETIRQQGHDLI